MKKSTALASLTSLSALILTLATGYCHAENTWHLSVLSGSGQASSPAVQNDNDIGMNSRGVKQYMLHIFDSPDSDGNNLYYEFLYSTNDISTSLLADSADANSGYDLDIEVSHLHLGGTLEWLPQPYLRPYFSATLGMSEYKPEQGDKEQYVSGSLAVGTKIRIIDSLALRFEARAFATGFNDSSHLFCNDSATCNVDVSGSLWLQTQMSAGLTVSF